MSLGLTQRQRRTLDFIGAYLVSHSGVAPSYDEIVSGVGLSSKSEVARLVTALKERGHIRTGPAGSKRSLAVIDATVHHDSDSLSVAREHVSYCISQGMGLRLILETILGAAPHHTSLMQTIEAVAKAYEELHS